MKRGVFKTETLDCLPCASSQQLEEEHNVMCLGEQLCNRLCVLQTTVSLNQCFKDSAISFITWSEVGPDGTCSSCAGSKVEDVAPNTSFGTFTVDTNAGECRKSICMYVHDGKFRNAGAPAPEGSDCISTDKQRCQLCNYEQIEVRATRATFRSAEVFRRL